MSIIHIIVVEQGILWEFKFYSQTIPEKMLRTTGIMVPLGNCFLYRMRGRRYKKKRKRRNGRREGQEEKRTEIKRMTKTRRVFMLVLYVAVKKRRLEDKPSFEESVSQGSQSVSTVGEGEGI